MSMQKEIIDKIMEKDGNFLIGLKTNQRALRYGVKDRPIESTHWGLDYNLLQDRIKRKSGKSAHNLICQLFIFK